MYRVLKALAIVLLGGLAAGCVPGDMPGGPVRTAAVPLDLAPVSYGQLPGWSADNIAQAVPAFVRSCERLIRQQADGAPLDPSATGADFGRVQDWRPLCQEAAALPHGNDMAARRFFESNFVPVLVASRGQTQGLFTGYWEVELAGSRTRQGPYQTPIYRLPPDLKPDRAYLTRAQIEEGALSGKRLEILWLKSPDDLFALQTQGSGRVHLAGGGTVHLVSTGTNRREAVDVGQLLLDGGEIARADYSQENVRAWMRAHPQQARQLRREDPSYTFFAERRGDGPVGYQGTVLTAERSLAVDHHYIPLGAPLWLDAQDKYRPVAVRRLVVAQDTGDAISGPLRGDFYWGSGAEAVARGANFYADGRYWVLLPKNVATRMVASLN